MRLTQYHFIHLLGGLMGAIGCLASDVRAQSVIVPDNTLGGERSVVLRGPRFDLIQGGANRGVGLFHSFSEFNVGDRANVQFVVQPEIQNIFARVTGSNASQVLGTLGTAVIRGNALGDSSANLFLLNPNGILFGPNAKLDLAGSFLATTASSIKFDGGQTFSAVNPQISPLLTVSAPLGLSFGQNVGGIEINGATLLPGRGKTLAFVGGEIQISSKATLFAESGRIDIGAVGPRESVDLVPARTGWGIDYRGTGGFKDISVNNSTIFGTGSAINGDTNIFFNSGSFISENGTILTLKESSGSDGNISIEARGATIVRANDAGQSSIFASNEAQPGLSGGNIKIITPSLSLLGGSSVSTLLAGQGKAGNIDIEATEKIVIEGSSSSAKLSSPSSIDSGVSKEGIGLGGLIRLKSKNIELLNGGSIGTANLGKGNTGEIELQATEDIIVSGTTPVGLVSSISNRSLGSPASSKKDTALPPGIKLSATNLILQNGGSVSTDSFSDGNARDIVIDVTNEVRVEGAAPSSAGRIIDSREGSLASQITLATSSISTAKGADLGDSGDITIRARSVKVLEGGSINSDITQAAYVVFGLAIPSGNAFQGRSGNITIDATDLVLVDGKTSELTSTTLGTYGSSSISNTVGVGANAQGGKILIRTKDLQVKAGANISSDVLNAQGKGGEIEIIVSGNISILGEGRSVVGTTRELANSPSYIASDTSTPQSGNAGSIKLNADSLTISGGGGLTTNTSGVGEGGNIFVNVNRDINLSGVASTGRPSSIASRSESLNPARRALALSRLKGSSIIDLLPPDEVTGNGGTIQIKGDILRVSEGAEISAFSNGQGNSGTINLNLSDRVILNKGEIKTTSEKTTGGNIAISAKAIILRDDSNIKTNIASGSGQGGNIRLTADAIILLDDSDLLAFARDGSGGNISLFTQALLTRTYKSSSPGADLATLDKNGFVDINATGRTSGIITLPELNPLQNNRPELNQGLIDTDQAISRSCLNRDRKSGKFYITGTGGLPAKPGDPSLSTYSTLPAGGNTAIAEADNLYTLASGQVVAGKACQTMEEKS
jgi:filamentous hemagglutinin family protein